MPPYLKTHLNRAFDHLDAVIYLMNEARKGKTAREIKSHLVEDDPFSHRSREYRNLVANWLADPKNPFTCSRFEERNKDIYAKKVLQFNRTKAENTDVMSCTNEIDV